MGSPSKANSFDPWTATQKEAEDRARATNDPTPLFQQQDAARIRRSRRLVVDGDGASILLGIANCVESGLVVPEWLGTAFLKCYDDVHCARARSWNDVFGEVWPKGTRLADTRRRLESERSVFRALTEHQLRGVSIDAAFARVGATHHMSAGTVREIYYASRERLAWMRVFIEARMGLITDGGEPVSEKSKKAWKK